MSKGAMMAFRVVGRPIYGTPVRVPMGYEWAKGEPQQSTICGIPVFDIDGNPYDFKAAKGMFYTQEMLDDMSGLGPSSPISWNMSEIISEPKEAKDGV